MFFKRGKQDKFKPVDVPPEAPKDAGSMGAGN
jgi:hypothetical protein